MQISVGLMPLDGRRGVWIAQSILAFLSKESVSRAGPALLAGGKMNKPTSGRAAELEKKRAFS